MNHTGEQLTIEHESITPQGVYPILQSIDESVREVKNEQYIFRRETTTRFAALEKEAAETKSKVADLTVSSGKTEGDMAEVKLDVKELRGDISELKGDMKALIAGLGAAQARFNWGLVILGIIIALIQMLK